MHYPTVIFIYPTTKFNKLSCYRLNKPYETGATLCSNIIFLSKRQAYVDFSGPPKIFIISADHAIINRTV